MRGVIFIKDIEVFATRIEISPYIASKDDPIVKQCSTSFDPQRHRREAIGCHYLKDDQKLLVMRGIDLTWLQEVVGGYPQYNIPCRASRMKYKHKMKNLPRSQDQLRAIKFLIGYGEFSQNRKYTQLALNTEPSFGKTYCSITASLERGLRTLIIVHNTTIKEQWITSILEKTTVTKDRILDIAGSENMNALMDNTVDADFIIILHQSLISYFKLVGYKKMTEWFDHLECGTKIIDEAHLFFADTVKIDLASNIEKTYYLTGTMTRSNPLEVGVFKKYFSNTPSFGRDLAKTRNVIFEFVEFDSYPTLKDQAYIQTSRGPNSSRYIKYAMEMDPEKTLMKALLRTLRRAKSNEGRIAIVLPKIETCESLKKVVSEIYPEDMVCTVHSRHKAEDNDDAKKNASIIITTISTLGTGADLKDLRNLIIADLYSSEVTSTQLPKRLGRGGEESYCYELTDTGFDSIQAQVFRKTKYLKKCCKKVIHSSYTE